MDRIHALLLSTAVITAGPVWAQSIEDWDTDSSGAVDAEEWVAGTGVLELFPNWDASGDGTLGEREFASCLFGRFDQDDEGALNRRNGTTALTAGTVKKQSMPTSAIGTPTMTTP